MSSKTNESHWRCFDMGKLEVIGFGGGCHWCTEAVFQSVVGVEKVEQGWIAPKGSEQFSEAVLVHYDRAAVSLERLVAIHLHSHSSTSEHSMRDKYRSAVYVFDDGQGDAVKSAMIGLEKDFDLPIVTRILPFGSFKLNGPEFLDYYLSGPNKPFCKTYIEPKLISLAARFSGFVIPFTEKSK